MKITIHCSDSQWPHHDDITVIHQWHTEPPRNWRKGGYHFFIKSNGDIQDYESNPVEARRVSPFESGAHVRNNNKDNIGICLHGKHEFTEAQFTSLNRLVRKLMFEHSVPKEEVKPHNYYDKGKTCPNFDIDEVLWKIKVNLNPKDSKRV